MKGEGGKKGPVGPPAAGWQGPALLCGSTATFDPEAFDPEASGTKEAAEPTGGLGSPGRCEEMMQPLGLRFVIESTLWG